METEQNYRRLYKNIAEGRIRHGNMRLARSEVLDWAAKSGLKSAVLNTMKQHELK